MAGSLTRKYTPNHTDEMQPTGKITFFIALLFMGEREVWVRPGVVLSTAPCGHCWPPLLTLALA